MARVRPPSIWPLPQVLPQARSICHELRCLEDEGFQVFETIGGVDSTAERRTFHGLDRLTWYSRGQGLELCFRHGRAGNPITGNKLGETTRLVLRRDQMLRIDWNARLPMSLSGDNRAVVYEQRSYLLQFGNNTGSMPFGQTPPEKIVDLKRHLY